MSGASDILDPVEAARNEISRSKHLIASTLDDLSKHHSWLEDYHRAERQRTERLRRQQALRRLELRRQRAAWTLRYYAVASYAALRTGAAFAMRYGSAFCAWTAPRARVLAGQAQRTLSAAASWSSHNALIVAREGRAAATTGYGAVGRGFAWSVQASDDAGIVFRRAASARAVVLSARMADIAAPARKRAMIALMRISRRATPARRRATIALMRMSRRAAPARRRAAVTLMRMSHRASARTRLLEAQLAVGVARVAQDTQRLFERYTQGRGARTGRALIVRPNTALACVERPRARLPAIRAR